MASQNAMAPTTTKESGLYRGKTHLPDPSCDVNRPPATPVPLEDEGVTKRTDDTDESSAGPGNNSIRPDRDIKKASLEYMPFAFSFSTPSVALPPLPST